MSELTITEMRHVTGWSYPTAFNFARKHGRQRAGVWFIPFEVVSAEVQKEVITAQRKQARLVELANGQ